MWKVWVLIRSFLSPPFFDSFESNCIFWKVYFTVYVLISLEPLQFLIIQFSRIFLQNINQTSNDYVFGSYDVGSVLKDFLRWYFEQRFMINRMRNSWKSLSRNLMWNQRTMKRFPQSSMNNDINKILLLSVFWFFSVGS